MSFFGITSDGNGTINYLNWKQRQQTMAENPKFDPDDPAYINSFFGFSNDDVMYRNSYEYNPFTGKLTQKELNVKDDSAMVMKQIQMLDLQTIIEPFRFHSIVQPLNMPKVETPTEKMIELLEKWASIREFLYYFRHYSVGHSVVNTIKSSMAQPTAEFLLNSVVKSVVLNGLFDGTQCDAYVDAIYAYASSFFHFKEWDKVKNEPFVNPFQSCIDLWNMGIIPASNGKYWRLCSGEEMDTIYEYGKGWKVGDKVTLTYEKCRQLEHFSRIGRDLSGVWEIISLHPELKVKYYNGVILCLCPWEIERSSLCDRCGYPRNKCEAKNVVMCGGKVTYCESSDASW